MLRGASYLEAGLTLAAGEVKVKRWNRDEYYRLGEAGLLEGKRSELIQGEIFLPSTISPRHSMVIALLHDEFFKRSLGRIYTRIRMPLALDNFSEPEPDLAIVPGRPEDHMLEHPTSALLVIEVSDSSLQHDRDTKSALYSQAGIQEYWLVDLIARQVEVRTQPCESGYGRIETYHSGEAIAPLMAPSVAISVAEILP